MRGRRAVARSAVGRPPRSPRAGPTRLGAVGGSLVAAVETDELLVPRRGRRDVPGLAIARDEDRDERGCREGAAAGEGEGRRGGGVGAWDCLGGALACAAATNNPLHTLTHTILIKLKHYKRLQIGCPHRPPASRRQRAARRPRARRRPSRGRRRGPAPCRSQTARFPSAPTSNRRRKTGRRAGFPAQPLGRRGVIGEGGQKAGVGERRRGACARRRTWAAGVRGGSAGDGANSRKAALRATHELAAPLPSRHRWRQASRRRARRQRARAPPPRPQAAKAPSQRPAAAGGGRTGSKGGGWGAALCGRGAALRRRGATATAWALWGGREARGPSSFPDRTQNPE
jgi:hypothetical protein